MRALPIPRPRKAGRTKRSSRWMPAAGPGGVGGEVEGEAGGGGVEVGENAVEAGGWGRSRRGGGRPRW